MDSDYMVRPVKLMEEIKTDLKRLIKLQELIVEGMYLEATMRTMPTTMNATEYIKKRESLWNTFSIKILKTINVGGKNDG